MCRRTGEAEAPSEAVEAGSTLYVTWDIISETLTLLRYRYGRDHKLSFCHAVSFVVVTTLLNDIPTLAFDAGGNSAQLSEQSFHLSMLLKRFKDHARQFFMFLHRGIKDGLLKSGVSFELGFNLLEESLLFLFILGFGCRC